MKTKLLLGIAILGGMVATAQIQRIREGIKYQNVGKEQSRQGKPSANQLYVTPIAGQQDVKSSQGANSLTILNLGTSANLESYMRGTRTMLWADDDLDVVVNFHRMGPGAASPALSGFLGMDLGVNMGKTLADWTNQIVVQTANLPASPEFYDACRFPSAGIFNPPGNTLPENAFLAYFAPNFANLMVSGLGGYSYGTANLVNHTDTTKHTKWYNRHPFTHIPDGFTVASNGIIHMVDGDYNTESGVPVYQDSIIYGRGVWNYVTEDFDYTFTTLAFPSVDNVGIADCKIATSPDGKTVWMSVLIQLVGSTPLLDSTYAPVLRKSEDCGLTWGPPIVIQLDGPNGLSGIKNHYTDYFIQNFFIGPPYPTRDEIPYTTAFDHSLSVDKWGFPHIGVAIGYAPGHCQITTGVDSLINVYDITRCHASSEFEAVFMGTLKTFRGTWGANYCDNRVYVSRNKQGDKMFLTWNDTHVAGEVDNQHPDIFARGYDLLTNKTTSVSNEDIPHNVTGQSAIAGQAYWQTLSPLVFTDNNKFILPIATQWFADENSDAQFKYIADFSFQQGDFCIPTVLFWPCYFDGPLDTPALDYTPCGGVGTGPQHVDDEAVTIFPNPAEEILNVEINLKQPAVISLKITDLPGKQLFSMDYLVKDIGLWHHSVDVKALLPGIYFMTVSFGGNHHMLKFVKN